MNINIIKISTITLLTAGQFAFAEVSNRETDCVVKDIIYLEEEDRASINFNTEAYLPAEFNPYAAPENIFHVSYIEKEEQIDLGFDTKDYLPKGFDPHKFFFDINSIEYIDERDMWEIDFDTQQFLPKNFDASIGR